MLRASPHPIVVSVAASVEFAVVGGVYTGIKHSLLETRIKEEVTPKTRIYISTLSGSLSFAFASVITRKLFGLFDDASNPSQVEDQP